MPKLKLQKFIYASSTICLAHCILTPLIMLLSSAPTLMLFELSERAEIILVGLTYIFSLLNIAFMGRVSKWSIMFIGLGFLSFTAAQEVPENLHIFFMILNSVFLVLAQIVQVAHNRWGECHCECHTPKENDTSDYEMTFLDEENESDV